MEFPTIRELYKGDRGNENSIPLTKRYKYLLQKAVDGEEEFLKVLSNYPDILQAYEKFHDIEMGMWSENAFNFYAEGLRFGILLGLDVGKN